MNKTKHTPGDWSYVIVGSRDLENGGYANVCEIRNEAGDLIADHVDECDAPLIAAAKSLLEKCCEYRQFIGTLLSDAPDREIEKTLKLMQGGVNEAIAKANAEPQ